MGHAWLQKRSRCGENRKTTGLAVRVIYTQTYRSTLYLVNILLNGNVLGKQYFHQLLLQILGLVTFVKGFRTFVIIYYLLTFPSALEHIQQGWAEKETVLVSRTALCFAVSRITYCCESLKNFATLLCKYTVETYMHEDCVSISTYIRHTSLTFTSQSSIIAQSSPNTATLTTRERSALSWQPNWLSECVVRPFGLIFPSVGSSVYISDAYVCAEWQGKKYFPKLVVPAAAAWSLLCYITQRGQSPRISGCGYYARDLWSEDKTNSAKALSSEARFQSSLP